MKPRSARSILLSHLMLWSRWAWPTSKTTEASKPQRFTLKLLERANSVYISKIRAKNLSQVTMLMIGYSLSFRQPTPLTTKTRWIRWRQNLKKWGGKNLRWLKTCLPQVPTILSIRLLKSISKSFQTLQWAKKGSRRSRTGWLWRSKIYSRAKESKNRLILLFLINPPVRASGLTPRNLTNNWPKTHPEKLQRKQKWRLLFKEWK